METESIHGMEDVLAKLKGRKEMRKENIRGVIRFKSGDVDSRDVSRVFLATTPLTALTTKSRPLRKVNILK